MTISIPSSGGTEKGSPVTITINGSESVTVPDGKYWVVTVINGGGGRIAGEIVQSESTHSVTLHEGEIVSSGSSNGDVSITGWERSY